MKKRKSNLEDYNQFEEARRIASQIGHVMHLKESPHKELDRWLENTEVSKEVTHRLSTEATLSELCDNFEREEKFSGSERLTNHLNHKRSKLSNRRLLKIVSLSSAAAMIGLTLLLFTNSPEASRNQITEDTFTTGSITKNFITPTLVLTSGKSIDLTTSDITERLTQQSTIDTLEYNTVIIPKKYTYTLHLEDGSTVHLNACSELRYPNQFLGENREVFLKGEAFFEVAKGSKPFIVHLDKMSVRVYGTKFNINSYNSSNLQTMLIEGAISVTQTDDGKETFLQPNQLLTIDQNGKETILNVSSERYTAWMSGFICNDDEPITNLLDNIAKWYGVEFTYNKVIKSMNINASLNRDRPLEEVIAAIKSISGLKITKEEGDKYMVE